jgi:hypothetical protein
MNNKIEFLLTDTAELESDHCSNTLEQNQSVIMQNTSNVFWMAVHSSLFHIQSLLKMGMYCYLKFMFFNEYTWDMQ